MRRITDTLNNPNSMVKVHRFLALLWFILIIPTVAWWHSSILWVGLMSAYALGVGHWSAAQAAEGELDQIHRKIDDIHDLLNKRK